MRPEKLCWVRLAELITLSLTAVGFHAYERWSGGELEGSKPPLANNGCNSRAVQQ